MLLINKNPILSSLPDRIQVYSLTFGANPYLSKLLFQRNTENSRIGLWGHISPQHPNNSHGMKDQELYVFSQLLKTKELMRGRDCWCNRLLKADPYAFLDLILLEVNNLYIFWQCDDDRTKCKKHKYLLLRPESMSC